MTETISNRRKALALLLAAGSLALVLTPGAALAKGRDDGAGFGAAALAGGIALAALAAAAASAPPRVQAGPARKPRDRVGARDARIGG